MLAKKNRLSRKDFVLVKKHGKNFTTSHFSLVVFKPATNSHQLSTRCSVVTSAKLSKSAVVRNRLRRRIYDQLSTINYQLSTDIILYPKPSVLNLTGEEIGLELNSFLSKINS